MYNQSYSCVSGCCKAAAGVGGVGGSSSQPGGNGSDADRKWPGPWSDVTVDADDVDDVGDGCGAYHCVTS